MIVNLLAMSSGIREVKRSEADMRDNLCILLVANNVECRIVDSYKPQQL